MVWRAAPDGYRIYNKRLLDYFGHRSVKSSAGWWKEFIRDVASGEELLANLETQSPSTWSEIRGADAHRWFNVRGAAEPTTPGAALVGVMIDVDDQKKAEEARAGKRRQPPSNNETVPSCSVTGAKGENSTHHRALTISVAI